MLLKLSRNVFFSKGSVKRNVCCDVQLLDNRFFCLFNNEVPRVCQEAGHESNTALNVVTKDVSELSPYFPKSFNFAAYVNSSESLKTLVQLNVDLSKIEKKPFIAEKLLKLDLAQSIKEYIFFIKDYVGVDEIGNIITKNPMILCEPLDDLKVRINYLQSKRFTPDQVTRIISTNPFWLMFSTNRIDKRLGYYQQKFALSGQEMRMLTTKQPKLVTYNLHHVNINTFVIKEEMGFEENEIKQLILSKPKLWMISKKALLERFNYLHNKIKIPHSMLIKFPEALLCRNFKVKQRYLFLKQLGRAQFDPTKENFIEIKALFEGTDVEFCKKYASCSVKEFNIFLKTM